MVFLNVEAYDKSGGNRKSITITADIGRRSQEEIDAMLKAAEQFAGEDKKMRETVEAKNKLETAAYNLKNELGDESKLGGRVSETDKETLTEACNDVISWLEENTDAEAEDYKDKQATFDSIVQPIMKNFYQQAGGAEYGGQDTEEDYGSTDHEDL